MLSLTESRIATELQLAIERDELHLVYQPKIDLGTGEMVGVEALARWEHPEFGEVDTAAFVATAERFGVIDSLTQWLFTKALQQWVAWCEQGIKVNIAFNVSALSLRDVYLPDYLQQCCLREGVPTECITIEVTEGATQHVVKLLDTLTRIRLKGMALSLDDFGTGYSSLLQLRQLPYSELKIDQCFVQECISSREARMIVQSVVNLAHGLDLAATAEGVEDMETLAFLKELGCDRAQGFAISHPLAGPALPDWIVRCAPQWKARCGDPSNKLRLVSSN